MKKRILCILLAALCVLPSAACASSGEPEETKAPTGTTAPADTTVPDETTAADTDDGMLHDSLGPADFEQAEYIIFGGSNRATKAVTAAEQNGEPINDAQYTARTNVEDRFNVRISYVDVGDNDTAVAVMTKQLVDAGDDTYAIGYGQDGNTINLSLQGYLYNLHTIEQFDFDQPWWSDATKELAFGDHYYAASSFLSYYCLYMTKLLVVNKQIAADRNIEIPYEKVFDGKWYLDDFAQFISAATDDLNGDGVMDANDLYGLSYQPGSLTTFQSSMGVTIYSKGEDNMPYLDFNLERALEYLGVMEPLLEKNGYKDPTSYGAPFFSQGRALAAYCMLREVCTIIRDTDISYGFLPAPKLNEDQKEYKTASVDILWSMPRIHKAKVDMIGTVTEALSCQHYNLVRPAFFETTMKGKLSDSPNDAKVLDMIPATLTIDFGYAYYQVITPIQTLLDLANKTKVGNLASVYKKLSGPLEKYLNDIAATFEKMP